MFEIALGYIAATIGAGVIAIAAFRQAKRESFSYWYLLGIALFTVGLTLITNVMVLLHTNPDIPVGVKMTVVASYTSVDGDSKKVLQWQAGKEKLDNEATVSIKRLNVESGQSLHVGDTIVKLDNGTTIVLSAKEATADRTFH